MSIPVHCPRCGYRGISRMVSIQNSTNVTFEGGSETCPQCGGRAEFQSGTYDFVGEVMTAFRAPGMTREKVEAVRHVAKQASGGVLTSEDAIQQLKAISEKLGDVVERSGNRGVNWELILALLLAIYTIWSDQKSDADAQAALAEARTQTEVAQKMLEESKAQSASLRELVTRPALPQQVQAQTTAPKNRHERRKAAAIERRTQGRDK